MTNIEQKAAALTKIAELQGDVETMRAHVHADIAAGRMGRTVKAKRAAIAQACALTEFWRAVVQFCDGHMSAAEVERVKADTARFIDGITRAGDAEMPSIG